MKRAIHKFTLPAGVLAAGSPADVGLVELTSEEELMAAKRCGNDPIRLTFELAKESLRWYGGRAVSTSDGTSDAAWQMMHPKARNLVVRAFGQLHNPSDVDALAFLQSRQTEV